MLAPVVRSDGEMSGFVAFPVFAVLACSGPDSGGSGEGPEHDTRLITDLYTWGCGIGGEDPFLGVLSQNVSLEVAPDALAPRDLPPPGECLTGLDLFPSDAGPGGADPQDLGDDVAWTSKIANGTLRRRSPGFWTDPDGGTRMSCLGASDVGSVHLEEAGVYVAAATPPAPSDGFVAFSKTVDDGIAFGDEEAFTFEAPGWDAVWIQLRRERQGEAWESVTCNATGQSSFTLGASHWALLDEDLTVDDNTLLVVFESSEVGELEDGQTVEVVTRSVSRAADL